LKYTFSMSYFPVQITNCGGSKPTCSIIFWRGKIQAKELWDFDVELKRVFLCCGFSRFKGQSFHS
jgi:hypothetical protein